VCSSPGREFGPAKEKLNGIFGVKTTTEELKAVAEKLEVLNAKIIELTDGKTTEEGLKFEIESSPEDRILALEAELSRLRRELESTSSECAVVAEKGARGCQGGAG
jgi:hypothetical protein